MRELIQRFLQSNEQTMIVPYKGRANAMQEWHRIQSSLRVYKNYLSVALINLSPSLRLKSFACRHMLGMNIGTNVSIGPQVIIDPFYPELITIEDDAIIGWNARLLCHEFTERHIRIGRVHIGPRALLGAFSTMRAGTSIGVESVVGMDSLVTRDIPPRELWVGVPARKKRSLKKVF